MLVFWVFVLCGVSACSGHMDSLTKKEIRNTLGRVGNTKFDQARQTVDLALEYHDQGGYDKSAELFLEAAGLFREVDALEEERSALIAAAKVQLKRSHKEAFLLTMTRFTGLVSRLEMPSDEERFLINLADHMNGRPLRYPVKESWQAVFKD